MSDALREWAEAARAAAAPYTADPDQLDENRRQNARRDTAHQRQLNAARRAAAPAGERFRRVLGRAGLSKGRCRCCGALPTENNPLYDYQHKPDCMVYERGSCTCGQSGYLAHRYQCPAPVDGKDYAAPEPS